MFQMVLNLTMFKSIKVPNDYILNKKIKLISQLNLNVNFMSFFVKKIIHVCYYNLLSFTFCLFMKVSYFNQKYK